MGFYRGAWLVCQYGNVPYACHHTHIDRPRSQKSSNNNNNNNKSLTSPGSPVRRRCLGARASPAACGWRGRKHFERAQKTKKRRTSKRWSMLRRCFCDASPEGKEARPFLRERGYWVGWRRKGYIALLFFALGLFFVFCGKLTCGARRPECPPGTLPSSQTPPPPAPAFAAPSGSRPTSPRGRS